MANKEQYVFLPFLEKASFEAPNRETAVKMAQKLAKGQLLAGKRTMEDNNSVIIEADVIEFAAGTVEKVK